ncbi:hypothetical protein J2785_000229 [Burkholderia ambifaria]|nr:hypothetical protein [Burkholderia ambifaria]
MDCVSASADCIRCAARKPGTISRGGIARRIAARINDAEEREDARIVALKQAAKAQPKAAYDLGLRYFRGDGVRQDSYQARKWMRDAAERDRPRRQGIEEAARVRAQGEEGRRRRLEMAHAMA